MASSVEQEHVPPPGPDAVALPPQTVVTPGPEANAADQGPLLVSSPDPQEAPQPDNELPLESEHSAGGAAGADPVHSSPEVPALEEGYLQLARQLVPELARRQPFLGSRAVQYIAKALAALLQVCHYDADHSFVKYRSEVHRGTDKLDLDPIGSRRAMDRGAMEKGSAVYAVLQTIPKGFALELSSQDAGVIQLVQQFRKRYGSTADNTEVIYVPYAGETQDTIQQRTQQEETSNGQLVSRLWHLVKGVGSWDAFVVWTPKELAMALAMAQGGFPGLDIHMLRYIAEALAAGLLRSATEDAGCNVGSAGPPGWRQESRGHLQNVSDITRWYPPAPGA